MPNLTCDAMTPSRVRIVRGVAIFSWGGLAATVFVFFRGYLQSDVLVRLLSSDVLVRLKNPRVELRDLVL